MRSAAEATSRCLFGSSCFAFDLFSFQNHFAYGLVFRRAGFSGQPSGFAFCARTSRAAMIACRAASRSAAPLFSDEVRALSNFFHLFSAHGQNDFVF
ncbi:hypothetical protein [Methylocystis echinoides]|uniref:hypothetical protein n=1 Tax=Methylocystis echinoides TaxID=29468 RepID=UPI003417AFCB